MKVQRFAILANLRDANDIPLVFPECKGSKLPHFKIWKKEFSIKDCEGAIIVLGLTGAEMSKNYRLAAQRVLDAVLYAQKEGYELVGLTSLTSSVTMKGEWLLCQPEVKVTLTHGDSYAVALTLEGVQKIASSCLRSPFSNLTIAVIGAYGLIGKAVSQRLMSICNRLILIGYNQNKINLLQDELNRFEIPKRETEIVFTGNMSRIKGADIIITATSNPNCLIYPSLIAEEKPVVVYEVSVPPNLPKKEYLSLQKERPLLTKIDGAMARIPPYINLKVKITEVAKGTTYACWGETIMQALENDRSNHVGDIEYLHVEQVRLWARKYGFSHAPFTCFGDPVPKKKPKPKESKELFVKL